MNSVLKRIFAAGAACTMILSLSGCDDSDSSTAPSSSQASSVTESQGQNTPVELKDYSFPEFLKTTAATEMLSNEVYRDFDPSQALTEPEENPFPDKKIQNVICGDYYTYTEDGYVGIINSLGNVVVKADKYVKAEPVSRRLVRLDYPAENGKGSELILLDGGYGTMYSDSFDASRITYAELVDENTGKSQLSIIANGYSYDSFLWDKFEQISPSSVVTQKSFSTIYRGSSGGRSYYIIFDEYYNMTVYEAAYALVKLKVSEDYGECYIVNGEDYTELVKMIDSFGSENQLIRPSKDETLDYIQITFGLGTEEQTAITISADGFCLRDMQETGTQPPNKYFSAYSKDTFVDIVIWVNEVLSQEWETEISEPQGDSTEAE